MVFDVHLSPIRMRAATTSPPSYAWKLHCIDAEQPHVIRLTGRVCEATRLVHGDGEGL
jgi:hypothetical protein